MKALEGVRILDMSHVQPGPIFTKFLARVGAEYEEPDDVQVRFAFRPTPALQPSTCRP
jgi:crotonobetainyl-CoA:carnitine CoA-transferase CaiB-like acyl-CoA transferase